jgi:hypothetical protein
MAVSNATALSFLILSAYVATDTNAQIYLQSYRPGGTKSIPTSIGISFPHHQMHDSNYSLNRGVQLFSYPSIIVVDSISRIASIYAAKGKIASSLILGDSIIYTEFRRYLYPAGYILDKSFESTPTLFLYTYFDFQGIIYSRNVTRHIKLYDFGTSSTGAKIYVCTQHKDSIASDTIIVNKLPKTNFRRDINRARLLNHTEYYIYLFHNDSNVAYIVNMNFKLIGLLHQYKFEDDLLFGTNESPRVNNSLKQLNTNYPNGLDGIQLNDHKKCKEFHKFISGLRKQLDY